MNGSKFATLPSKDKKKIVKSAVLAANEEQQELVRKYEELEKHDKNRD